MFKLNGSGLIDAIKTVRTLAQGQFKVELIGGQFVVSSDIAPVGLKEAKEFIEDVMALGVRRFLDDQANQAARLHAARERQRLSPAAVYSDDIKF